MFFRSLAALLILALTSCANPKVIKTGRIDPSQKSITIPPGAAMAPIKAVLTQAGWSVKASGVLAATGSFGTTASTGGLQTRYVMAASLSYRDMMLVSGEVIYHYDISILDAKTNEEVLNMSGQGLSEKIAERLKAALSAP